MTDHETNGRNNDIRLIERWLPIAELGVESLRERTPMTPFPAPNRLHVWWARRPLVTSRAAILGSLLPADIDKEWFLHMIGIHGKPVKTRRKIDMARKKGVRFKGHAYTYPRAFNYILTRADGERLEKILGRPRREIAVLDPTAGGGSVPFEAVRLGIGAIANDLNPVATLVMRATLAWPSEAGRVLSSHFSQLAKRFIQIREDRLKTYYPPEPETDCVPANYLWARTVRCPYCNGLVPLSPNWRLSPDGVGVRMVPKIGSGLGDTDRKCSFEVVTSLGEQSEGTVARGDGNCPYPDCRRVFDGGEIKRQAREGKMGEQLFAVVYKRRVQKKLKSGKAGRTRWVRGYRAPRPEDDNGAEVRARLDEKLPEWGAFDILPSESIPDGYKTTEPQRYGMRYWRELFSPRQLLCHGTSVEVYREMLETDRSAGTLSEISKAAYGYLALSIDKLLNYNCRMTRWIVPRQVVASKFDRHDFAFVWSYAEMSPLIAGIGYDWAIRQTGKCIEELVSLTNSEAASSAQMQLGTGSEPPEPKMPPVAVTCKPGDSLEHIPDSSVDVVVMDPPYYDNVMYAELSDFFYVWLKRTAGHVFPELFYWHLTDKDSEAVSNPMRFRGSKGARALASRDYQDRMASIFAECRRKLRPEGVLTLMFTHKASGAWDALAKGLMEAGFVITASWPINTEASGSLHIKDKAAANSTVFLACRPRQATPGAAKTAYWENVEPIVAAAVRSRVEGFQDAGIAGVDLYLASFGPALEEFSRHWPLRRGQPRRVPTSGRRRTEPLFGQEIDLYSVTPEDALEVARREVKRWRLNQLTHLKANADLDPPTAFFVLAWDAFKAPVFSYDEALRLARAVGVDLDKDIVGRLCEKKASDIRLWDSLSRASKGTLGHVSGSRGMIDAIHHAASRARLRHSLNAARELIADARVDQDPRFFASLEAVLEVLPVSHASLNIHLEGDLGASGSDFEVLYDLTRLAYREKVDEPEQFKLWKDEGV